MEWIEENSFDLVNDIGVGTFYRPNMKQETVLDLTFSKGISNFIENWQVIKETGSDHYGIIFDIIPQMAYKDQHQSQHSTTIKEQPRFHTKKANWEAFHSFLSDSQRTQELRNNILSIKHLPKYLPTKTPREIEIKIERTIQSFIDLIQQAAQKSIPTRKPFSKGKAWWNPELSQLRALYKKAGRDYNPITENHIIKETRNNYFKAIKEAKKEYWNNFLEKEDPETIFSALKYTKPPRLSTIPTIRGKNSFTEKSKIFKESLFPLPPQSSTTIDWARYIPKEDWKWPSLSKIELERACLTTLKKTTPGSDKIDQEIIKQAYKAIPDLFLEIYTVLLEVGHHPTYWKEAIGIVLPKPKKPDYSQPKAYRVISLLNCLGKISERIIAQRLGYLAETTNLLHPSQLGGRKKKSAVDTALLLVNKIESDKASKLQTSTIFLDIKGAYDHVSKERLLQILHSLQLPCLLSDQLDTLFSHQ